MNMKLVILDEDALDEHENELIEALGKSREEIMELIEEDKRTHHIRLVYFGEFRPW